MLPGPVFYVELLTLARRKRYFALRIAYGFILLYIFWSGFSHWSFNNSNGLLTIQQAATIGSGIFLSVVFLQSIAILLLTPALTAGVIADEKQRKTLHYLLASCLSSSEIVLGKLTSRLLLATVIVFLTLPILVMLSFVGGVDPNDVLLLTAASFSTMFVLGAFSICISVHARKPREALVIAYLGELVWLFGPSILKNLAPWNQVDYGFFVVPLCDVIGATSPFYVITDAGAFFRANPNTWYMNWMWMVGSQVLLGAVLTTVAVIRLRPVYRAEGARAKALSKARFRLLPRPECGDDPIWWKERVVSRHGPVARVLGLLLTIAFIALVAYWALYFGDSVIREIHADGYFGSTEKTGHGEFNVLVRISATFLLVCWQIAAASRAASALSGEREEDTWISLIATPLTPLEIVRGKWFGVLYGTSGLAVMWATLVVLGTLLGAIHPLGFVFGVVTTAVYVSFATSLGLFYSLYARTTTRAQVAAIGTLFFCNGVYLFCCIPITWAEPMAIIYAGVTPFIGAVSLLSYQDFRYLMFGPPHYLTLSPGFSTLLVTGVVSVVVYGGTAAILAILLISRFDDVLDRPRTDGGGSLRARRPLTLPASAIQFLDEDEKSKSPPEPEL